MSEAQVAPYGSWKSPVTTDLIVGKTIGLGRIVLDGDDTYWIEHRPWEEGRSVVVRRSSDGNASDVTPEGFSVGTRVHEYGTRGYTVSRGVVYFSNFEDQRLYRQRPDESPVAITPEGDARYGGMIVDEARNRVICVREDHSQAEDAQPVNDIVAVDAGGESDVQVLLTSNDFYSSPQLSPDGSSLAWLTWNHPNMPWDGTELWVSPVTRSGMLESPTLVAGGIDEAIMQPQWGPDGSLYFLSDRSGWANIYRWQGADIEPLLEMEADFSKTHWWIGMSSFGLESAEHLICNYVEEGTWRLARLDLDGDGERRLFPYEIPFTELGHGDLQVTAGRAVLQAGSPTRHLSIIEVDLSEGAYGVLQVSSLTEVDLAYISEPEAIRFPTENGLEAHAFYYPPTNPDYTAPEGELPPLMVQVHGGPHDRASIELDLTKQYWTSRGIAVVDVNYGGSTGHGREYRERLIGEWGVVDVDDSVNAAKYLIERGDVDANRTVISGGSAGGFTALAAMTFRDIFKAGASHFGVSDLEALLTDIHKFDTFSLVGLVGPYPLHRRRYVERSPINYADDLNCPVIFFQGLEDKIVPPEQSIAMYEALAERGIPTAYVAYEGEYHGFSQADNIKRTLEAELYFYSRVFGFPIADDVRPVRIINLEPANLTERLTLTAESASSMGRDIINRSPVLKTARSAGEAGLQRFRKALRDWTKRQ